MNNMGLWNGASPAVSINKDATAIRDTSLPGVNFWAQEGQCLLSGILWDAAAPQGGQGTEDVQSQISDTHESNDFREPRLLHLPIHRKLLNSLPWDILFSLTNNHLLMFRLLAPFCKCLYNLTPLCLLRTFLSGYLRCCHLDLKS